MERLRCFVAMRFDEPQTDAVYDKLITVALRKQGIVPIRVDRVEHNDNIDARILQEIKQCNIAIADLTFARPSVYFEAGYAEGSALPVIYTCRKDHLAPQFNDPSGNLRIHFDLSMKNIISWNHERDPKFLKKLVARIKKVVRPIVSNRARIARQKESHLRFSHLSIADRIYAIRKILHEQLMSAGFSRCNCEGCHYNYYWLRKKARGYILLSDWVGESCSKSSLRKVGYDITNDVDKIAKQRCKSNRPVVQWLICTLARNPPSQVQGAIPYFAQVQANPPKYVLQTNPMWTTLGPMKMYLHTIDNIRSEDDFSEILNATLTVL